MTHSPVLLILDGLAVARLTRLIVADSITARLRERVGGRKPAQARNLTGERMMIVARPRLAELISCPWCISPWLAGIVVACQTIAPRVWLYVSAVLAFSLAAGLISEHTQ